MGLAPDECWWSTWRSSWFGHQSWFVLGRCALGVGDGIAGFSLSLTLSVTSVLLGLVHSDGLWICTFVSRLASRASRPAGCRSPCRDALGTSSPVDDLGLVDLVAGVVGGRQAGGRAD